MPNDNGSAFVKQTIRARQSDIDSFVKSLEKILQRSLSGIVRDVKESQTAAAAANLLLRVTDLLKEAGLHKEIAKINRLYGAELEAVKKYFSTYLDANNIFTNADNQLVEALINLEVKRTTTVIQQHVDDVNSVIMSQILTGKKAVILKESDDLIGSAVERVAGVVRTELNTTISGFASSLNAHKAKDLGLNLFEYLGPDDKLTRPFCNRVLSKDPAIYQRSEIEKLSNGQGLPVLIYGGGYNCRHQWRAISEDLAKRLGYDA